jgi:hypothetical protein
MSNSYCEYSCVLRRSRVLGFARLCVIAMLFFVMAMFTGLASATAPYPSWWSGDCNSNNHTGSGVYTSYNGVQACGPGSAYGGYDQLVSFGVGAGEYEWECVELSMRYMYLVYGIAPYYLQGGAKDIVSAYPGSILTKVTNNGTSLPSPGDILAIGPNPYSPVYGHTSVVTAVNSSQVTVMEQNGSPEDGGVGHITVSNGVLGGYVTGWLHYPGSIVVDGTYVKTTASAAVYVVAGNSAIPVPSWSSVGGSKPVTTISQQQLNAMNQYPSDGTFVKQYGGNTIYVMAGGSAIPIPGWSTIGGSHPFVVIPSGSVAANFREYPSDGTFVKQYGGNTIYVMAGGSAIPIPGWSTIGGSHPFVVIPSGSVAANFREYPSDGTFVKQYGGNTIYVMAGGSAIPIPGWSTIGGSHPFVVIPSGSVAANFREYPSDGTYIVEYGNATVYIVAGGMGLTVTSFSAVGGPHPVVTVPTETVTDVLLQQPVDGTYVQGYVTSKIYEVSGGYAVLVTDWGSEGPQPYTVIDQWAIDNELYATE